MRQLIMGVVLAVFLVGCGEKPDFSISESDTTETYANNPAFTKVKVSDGKMAKDDKFGYQFTSAPTSVYGVDTSDLNVLGGTILIGDDKPMRNITLTIKGKENFGKLEERLNKLKAFDCDRADFGESKVFQCRPNLNQDKQDRIVLGVYYNPFSDIVSYNYMKYTF